MTEVISTIATMAETVNKRGIMKRRKIFVVPSHTAILSNLVK
jgi:hypothetical protein